MLAIQQRIIGNAMETHRCEYRPQQWGPRSRDLDKKRWYFDCIGEVYWVGNQSDALYFIDGCEEGRKWRSYPPTPNFKLFYEALDTFLVTLPGKWDAIEGDILWFKDGSALHLGIVTRTNPYYVIHASLVKEKVMHEIVRSPGAVLRSFRYPKVQEELNG